MAEMTKLLWEFVGLLNSKRIDWTTLEKLSPDEKAEALDMLVERGFIFPSRKEVSRMQYTKNRFEGEKAGWVVHSKGHPKATRNPGYDADTAIFCSKRYADQYAKHLQKLREDESFEYTEISKE